VIRTALQDKEARDVSESESEKWSELAAEGPRRVHRQPNFPRHGKLVNCRWVQKPRLYCPT
jgi:hypothetical protein